MLWTLGDIGWKTSTLIQSLVIQREVQSSRKDNLLEFFSHITEPNSSSQLCTKSRGMYKLCLLLIYDVFYGFYSYGI